MSTRRTGRQRIITVDLTDGQIEELIRAATFAERATPRQLDVRRAILARARYRLSTSLDE